jgi:ComF family protein
VKSWMQRLSKIAKIAEFCLESACPLCSRSTATALCLTCQQRVQQSALSTPEQSWQPPLPLFAWGRYDSSLKRAIAALKYENQPQLAEPLGQWLAQSWLASSLAPSRHSIWVVPIPMHPEKQAQRGFNQAELLAASFCCYTGLPLKPNALRRGRATTPQFGLSATARLDNLAGAFELDATLPTGATVLLLDDIYTTGATAQAAAQALRQRYSVCGIATVAKTLTAAKLDLAPPSGPILKRPNRCDG